MCWEKVKILQDKYKGLRLCMTHVYELYIPNTPYCMCVHIHTVCMYVCTYILCNGHNYLLVRCIILGVHVFTVHSPSEFGIYSQLRTYVHTEHVCMYISASIVAYSTCALYPSVLITTSFIIYQCCTIIKMEDFFVSELLFQRMQAMLSESGLSINVTCMSHARPVHGLYSLLYMCALYLYRGYI